jgi:hypothetical protein
LATSNHVAPEKSPLNASEEERREFEAVAAALAGSSRLSRLLTYIEDKYFSGETDQLQEYNIATEVFGRSKTTFNASEDAIVRVEFHRLRKRLKEYYDTEGKDHLLQLVIPAGSYNPAFVRHVIEENTPLSPPLPPEIESPVSQPQERWSWLYVATVAVLVLVALGLYQVFRSHKGEKESARTMAPRAAATAPVSNLAYAEMPLRILAGYSGKPQIDTAGRVWQPDEYFQYGGSWHIASDFVGRSSHPMLFEHWRNGQFSYDIPLRPGTYELHLYFMAVERNAGTPATFSVSANGEPLLSNFDIYFDTMGSNIADERVFRDIHPGPDGLLHLSFTGVNATASLNALEILPGTPHRQLPVRLVMQSRSVTDHGGNFWRPDDYYQGGYSSVKGVQVSGTSDPDLFAAERFGHFTYSIPVDARDRYTLTLYFAELYFGPNASGSGGAGSRIFRVLCNGTTLLDNFDIYKEAGGLHLLTRTFYHLKPTTDGKLNISFEPIVNNATVSAIEVLDESK